MTGQASGQLFPPNRLFLPSFRDDETLYSWCAYYHVLSSNPTSRQTCLQLFGHRDAGLKHDFPICIDTLIGRTEGHLGTRDQIIFDRTPVGALPRFIDSTRLQSICDLMGSSSVHHVARMLKILAIHQGSFAPLKACPRCVSEAVATSHSSAWRCEHQLPGVYFCRNHGAPLRIANAAGHQRARIEFLLPHMLSPLEWHEPLALSKDAKRWLLAFTMWSLELRRTSGSSYIPFDLAVLRDSMHIQANARGWVGVDGSLEFKKIRLAIGAAQADLFAVPGLEFLSGSQTEGGGYVGSLMRQNISAFAHHPIMYVALLAFLFDSTGEFFTCYKNTSEVPQDSRRDLLTSDRRMISESLAQLVGKEGMSVNQAAAAVGIHTSRAMVYLKERGIEWQKRPRIVGTPLEPQLIERLELGQAPTAISSEMNLRLGFIKDYLAAHPELRQRHADARLRAQCAEYRANFLQILEDNPSLPIKRIRRETNSGFEWLYRNDREWLLQILPGLWHR
jgi:hypothetical protein